MLTMRPIWQESHSQDSEQVVEVVSSIGMEIIFDHGERKEIGKLERGREKNKGGWLQANPIR